MKSTFQRLIKDTKEEGLETKLLLCIKLHTDVTSSLYHDTFAKMAE